MAPKRYTGSNSNPNPPTIVDDPEKLLKKPKTPIPESEPRKLVKTTSLPDQGLIVEDICFDIQFEQSLFQSKFESSLSEVIFDLIKFDSYLPSAKSLFSKTDHKLWLNFDKLQTLADQLQITTEEAYIQYQLENLATAPSSTSSLNTSTTSSSIGSLPLSSLVSSSPSTQPIVIPTQPIVDIFFLL